MPEDEGIPAEATVSGTGRSAVARRAGVQIGRAALDVHPHAEREAGEGVVPAAAFAREVLEIAVQNVEPILHDFTIDKIDADAHVSYLEGSGQHAHAEQGTVAEAADVHFPLSEPGIGVVHLKANEPGEYVFYCTVPGHREAGVEGTLIVREPASTT